jgi:hypothetical protein
MINKILDILCTEDLWINEESIKLFFRDHKKWNVVYDFRREMLKKDRRRYGKHKRR